MNGPAELTGKDFEKLIIAEFKSIERTGFLSGEKNGVQAAQFWDSKTKSRTVTTISSMPDMTGAFFDSTRFDFDAKVCGLPSFPLSSYSQRPPKDERSPSSSIGKRRRQMNHAYKYSKLGCVQGFLIHFTEIPPSKKLDARKAETFFLPIHERMAFWQAFENGEYKSVNRSEMPDWSIRVNWHGFNARNERGRPALREALIEARNYLQSFNKRNEHEWKAENSAFPF